MDKQRVMQTLTKVHDSLQESHRGHPHELMDIASCIEWLEETETVDEVLKALSQHDMHKPGFSPASIVFHSGGGTDVYGGTGKVIANGNYQFDLKPLSKTLQAPSSEPPDPSEIEPGEKVPTTQGLRVAVYPHGENRYIAMMPSGGYWQPVIVGDDHLDWQAWRKDREL